MRRRLAVRLYGETVGHLTERDDGIVELSLVPEYIERELDMVLGQQFEDNPRKPYRGKRGAPLPSFFANMLPERGGRLREHLVTAAGLPDHDDLALLALLGNDLPGAVTVHPIEGEWHWGDDDEDVPAAPADDSEDDAPLRFSLAGVQLKFSVSQEGDKLVFPAKDEAGDWIVKIPSARRPGLPENELSMMTWARSAGFDVPECAVVPLDALDALSVPVEAEVTSAFLIRRFDRAGDARIHQEDVAQVAGLWPQRKYDHLTFDTLLTLILAIGGDEAGLEFVRRVVLMLATGNADAHAKNWSLIYRNRVTPSLSPLYDQVFTKAYPTVRAYAGGRTKEVSDDLAFKVCGRKHFGEMDYPLLARWVDNAGLRPRGEVVIGETIERLRASWAAIHADLPMLPEHRERLRAHWRQVPVLKTHGELEG